eukprot:COSAG02_NODE_35561_length_466_cov_1.182561_1_plen_116_part_01
MHVRRKQHRDSWFLAVATKKSLVGALLVEHMGGQMDQSGVPFYLVEELSGASAGPAPLQGWAKSRSLRNPSHVITYRHVSDKWPTQVSHIIVWQVKGLRATIVWASLDAFELAIPV